MFKELFASQQQSLAYFYQHIDEKGCSSLFHLCLRTPGLLIFMGVGKSGLVAEKIAHTLISTGTRAIYLPTMNFLHGDIGLVSPDDCVIMLSKSGETEELVNLIPFIKKRGAKIVSWVSHRQSRLALQADFSLTLPVEKELCPFDLAPTTSTEVQLLLGDALAIALMRERGVSLSSYGDNHPAGSIGKKIHLLVKDLMLSLDDLPLCSPSTTVREALTVFSRKRLGCVLIVDHDSHLHGIFTDGDLRRSLQASGSAVLEERLEAVMTRAAITTRPEEQAWEALKLMQRNPSQWIAMLPVLDSHKLQGLIRMHDIIHAGIT